MACLRNMSESEDELKRILDNTVEIVNRSELEELLASGEERTAYIGFEPSGFIHLGWLILAKKIKDLTDSGFHVTALLADWHAYINDKLGGDMENIKACGRYLEDYFDFLGLPEDRFRTVYASDVVDRADYWETVLRVAKVFSLNRIKRAMTIMGRKEGEDIMDSSKYIYPPMQVTDIFDLKVNLALGGMDQRKAHMLAREAADKLGIRKPIALHTPLLSSLEGGERMDPVDMKMSKSKPDSALFIHDNSDDVKRKIKKAYCPAGQVEDNPILELWELIIFKYIDKPLIRRPEKFGGDLEIQDMEFLKEMFQSGALHPMDLKTGTAQNLDIILEPVRKYFLEHPENLEKVKGMTITR